MPLWLAIVINPLFARAVSRSPQKITQKQLKAVDTQTRNQHIFLWFHPTITAFSAISSQFVTGLTQLPETCQPCLQGDSHL